MTTSRLNRIRGIACIGIVALAATVAARTSADGIAPPPPGTEETAPIYSRAVWRFYDFVVYPSYLSWVEAGGAPDDSPESFRQFLSKLEMSQQLREVLFTIYMMQ